MAKKKSFSIGSSLTQALTDTVVAAKNYSGELHIEIVPLRKIELDVNNPRDSVLNFSDLYDGLSHDDDQYKRKNQEKEALKSIADSITKQGVINPIVVYKQGEKYRLIAGERRTLASILAGKEDIPAKILADKPSQLKLSLLQWIENVEREDLSLWERIRNLEKILEAHSHDQHKKIEDITPTELGRLVGCSLQQAINYKNVLSASATLLSYIQDNQIKNIEKAALIAKAPLKQQDLLIEKCLKGATLKELKQFIKSQQPDNNLLGSERRGRQATRVNFGATSKVSVAKVIIQAVLNNKHFNHLQKELGDILWDDYKSVTSAFKILVKKLENAN